jgi:anti-sigma-K factor RskA
MSVHDHDRFRDLTAAHVLGALDPEDRIELEDHLRDCQRCRADTIDFAPLPALLGLIDPPDLAEEDPTADHHLADGVVAGAREDLARLRSSRRRWRTAAAALLAGAAVVLAIAVVSVLLEDGDDGRDPIELAIDSVEGITGDVVVDERSWGTYVHLSVEGLPERDLYRLWAVDRAGAWHEAGTWLPTADASARLGGSTHLRLADIDRLVVTSDDQDDELLRTR